MPFPFGFRRELALFQLERIAQDRPIHHSGEGWTPDNLIQAAATLLGVAMFSGPPSKRHSPENMAKLSHELADTIYSRNQHEVLAAFRMCIDLVQRLNDGFDGTGDYDRHFDSVVKGSATLDENQADLSVFIKGDPAELEGAALRSDEHRDEDRPGGAIESEDDKTARLLDDPDYWKRAGAEVNAGELQDRGVADGGNSADDAHRILAIFRPLPVPFSRVQVSIAEGAKSEKDRRFSMYSS